MLCHHTRCIFVHIPKTAGQSVEHVFLERLGLTWETRAPLLLRENPHKELGPWALGHLRACEYVSCKYIPREMFDSYFRFSFVRNPWARMVSFYRHTQCDQRYTFHDFVLKHLPEFLLPRREWFFRPQWDYLHDGEGRLLVDFVGRFERLQEDFDVVCERLGIGPHHLPHVNRGEARRPRFRWNLRRIARYATSHRIQRLNAGKRVYTDFYDDETREAVAELYRRDIETFGYRFDDAVVTPAAAQSPG